MLIPVFEKVVYPLAKRLRIPQSPLQRMGLGMVICSAAFAISGFLQLNIENTYISSLPSAPSNTMTSVRTINIASANFTLNYGDATTSQLILANQSSAYTSIASGLAMVNVIFAGGVNLQYSFTFLGGSVNTLVINATHAFSFTDTYNVSIDTQSSYGRIRFVQLDASLGVISLTSNADPDFSLTGLQPLTASPFSDGLLANGLNGLIVKNTDDATLFTFPINVDPGVYYTCVIFENGQTVYFAENKGFTISIMSQLPQYFVITVSEILFSITGLEFAYSQVST